MDDYDRRRAALETVNSTLINEFRAELGSNGSSPKAAAAHIERLSFFANTYLIDYCDQSLAEGYGQIGGYLGDWFIRKAMWASPSEIKANIATFRKFYAFLKNSGRLTQEELDELKGEIAAESPLWLGRQQRYSDPQIPFEDVWDFDAGLSPQPAGPTHPQVAVTHFTFMCTGLTAKHFGIPLATLPKVDNLADADHWAACWRCDLFGSDIESGTFYFIFTNARTFFSLIVPNTDGSFATLIAFFSEILHHQFQLAGHSSAPLALPTFKLVRGQPRVLIGSQNDLRRMALYLFEDPSLSLDSLCLRLNHTPLSALPEAFPDRAFAQLLTSDPPLASSPTPNIIPFPQAPRP